MIPALASRRQESSAGVVVDNLMGLEGAEDLDRAEQRYR
jgi:hypothetical protein